MEPRRKNTSWRQRQSILEALIANGVPGGASEDHFVTQEGQGLLTQDGNYLVTQ